MIANCVREPGTEMELPAMKCRRKPLISELQQTAQLRLPTQRRTGQERSCSDVESDSVLKEKKCTTMSGSAGDVAGGGNQEEHIEQIGTHWDIWRLVGRFGSSESRNRTYFSSQ